MIWVLASTIFLVGLLIPILAIVLDSPILKKLVEARVSREGSGEGRLTDRILALEDEVGEISEQLETIREELRFTQRLLEKPDAERKPKALPSADD